MTKATLYGLCLPGLCLLAVFAVTPSLAAPPPAPLAVNECDLTPGSSDHSCFAALDATTGVPVSVTAPASQALTDATYLWASRIDPNPSGAMASFPIDIQKTRSGADDWGLCRFVDNTGTSPYFVPFKTKAEWQDFITNPPAGIKLTACARGSTPYNPVSYEIQPGPRCHVVAGTILPSATVLIPYARADDSHFPPVQGSTTFTCDRSNDSLCPTWWEKVSVEITNSASASAIVAGLGLPSTSNYYKPILNGWAVHYVVTPTYPAGANCGAAP